MAAVDRPEAGYGGKRYGRHRSTMIVNPTETDALLIGEHATPYGRVEYEGATRRTPMKWLSVAATFGLLAWVGLRTSSVSSRETPEDAATTVLQADDTEAYYRAQFEVCPRVTAPPSNGRRVVFA